MTFPLDGEGSGPAPSILIVDDHERTAHALAGLLRSFGYGTDVCHTGSAALEHASERPPMAAMIDIHLPDLNGLIVSQKLRQQLGPGVPLILVSGDTSMETLNSLPHVGATYFLPKPIQTSHLRAMISKWLKNRR